MAANPNRPTCKDPDCETKINANNSTGFCALHKSTAKKPAVVVAPAAGGRTRQAALFTPGPGELQLPPVAGLPDGYLVKCVEELKARAARMYAAARSIGFDPSTDTPPL